jgi:hypothetical protein
VSRAVGGAWPAGRHPPPRTHRESTHPERIDEPFGWIKTIAGGRKLRYIGQARNRAWFRITAAVYNLIPITALDATPA